MAENVLPHGARTTVPSAAFASALRRRLHLVPLAGVLLLAAFVDFWALAQNGYGNEYYTAAVRSMSQSWQAFLFGSFDPAGFVTVDKPPLALWVQVAGVKLLGFSGWAVLAPEALAGVAAVVALYRAVATAWGRAAGLLSALVLAVSPSAAVINRSNNTDSVLVLLLVLAAWALMVSLRTRRLRHLLLAFALVGLGFNTKMLAAYLVLPGMAAAYLLSAGHSRARRAWHLAAASALLLAISLAWVVAVDLTPAGSRPYVGSTTDNSALSLALGYNGLGRIFGQRQGGPGAAQPGPGSGSGPGAPAGAGGPPPGARFGGPPPPGAGEVPPQGFAGPPPGAGAPAAGQAGGPGGGQGIAFGGPPGWTRLLTGDLAAQDSWLLPLALAGLVSAALAAGLRRRSVRLGAVILAAGWIATTWAVFSFAGGIFHPYYIGELAPGVAAGVGIGLVALCRDALSRTWRLALPAGGVAAAALFELHVDATASPVAAWLPAVALTSAALAAVVAGAGLARGLAVRRLGAAALGLAFAGLLVAPAAWTGTVLQSAAGGVIPQAGPAAAAGLRGPGGPGAQAAQAGVLDYLERNWSGETYLVAVASATEAAPIEIATGRPVMAMGGFNGGDAILTPASLARLVAAGRVRYFLVSAGRGRGGPGGGTATVNAAITSACSPIPLAEGTLYDCAGKAGAIAAGAPGG